jgi:hypothetical protein
MTIAKVLVTLAGFAAVVWVLWYFLAPLGPSRAPRDGQER